MDFICICCDFISEIEKDSICDFTFGVCGRYVCNFIFVSTYVCLWLEFICLWCNLIFEIDMDFICDFFTRNVCGLCLHNYVFLFIYYAWVLICLRLHLGLLYLLNQFGFCVHLRLIYHACVIINWGMQFGVWVIWKTFLPFSHIMVLWYNSFLFLFLI